jgi:hypothetical protein
VAAAVTLTNPATGLTELQEGVVANISGTGFANLNTAYHVHVISAAGDTLIAVTTDGAGAFTASYTPTTPGSVTINVNLAKPAVEATSTATIRGI